MSRRILITGATGLLGRALYKEMAPENPVLAGRRKTIRVPDDRWRAMDLLTGSGVREAPAGIDVVLHLASATRGGFNRKVDVDGTKQLLRASRESGVKHFVHVSIVGINKVPYKYYRIKLEAEQIVRESGVAFTILRATQFHEFFDMILSGFLRFPVGFLLKCAKFQPVETAAVARKLAGLAVTAPTGGIVEIGGPEAGSMLDFARQWLDAQKKRRLLVGVPRFLLGSTGRALCDGALTTESRSDDSVTWEEWLRIRYERPDKH